MPVPISLARGITTRFLTDELLPSLFVFPADMQPLDVGINQLGDQLLVHYYEADIEDPLVTQQ
jgi:predicted membrane-bound spermidine synthase